MWFNGESTNRPGRSQMLIKRPDDIQSSEITPEGAYLNRRAFMGAAAAAAVGAFLPYSGAAERQHGGKPSVSTAVPPYRPTARQDDKLTPYDAVTTYNNFYEFGSAKSDP